MPGGVVIAGAGQAGFQCAFSLRAEGYDGPITLVGEEPYLPYQRPPLSKGCLLGKQDLDDVGLRPAAFYETNRIELQMGRRIASIDRAERRVLLDGGGELGYDYLILATGSRNRLLPVANAILGGVFYLRTRDEAASLMDGLETARSVVVIGGGFIGLEVAAAVSSYGMNVVVVEPQARLMQRAVGPVVSAHHLDLHTRHGVRIALGAAPAEILGGGGGVVGVRLNTGETLPADLVVAGIGVIPQTELAEAAGLRVENGIAVDEYLRTEDDAIYAVGDCASYVSRFGGGRVRLQSVQNAVDQARCVAGGIAGAAKPYDAVPWFWTDQYDAKLQMAGLSNGFDTEVVRGEVESGQFSVLYFRGGTLLAIDSVNRPGDHMAGRKLLAGGSTLTADQAADGSFELKTAIPA